MHSFPLIPSATQSINNWQSKIQESHECYISCSGADGVGHQMESKISCLATATALNITYVHQPMHNADHGEAADAMDKLFGMTQAMSQFPNAVLYDRTTHQILPRKYHEWCTNSQRHDNIVNVLSSDNCWEYFWGEMETIMPFWKNHVVPVLRKSFLSEAYNSTALKVQKGRNALHVTAHVRRGDAGERMADLMWYQHVILSIVEAARTMSRISRVVVTIHTDASSISLEKKITSVLEAYNTFVKVFIFGKGDTGATIAQAMFDMVTADIFVASASSLSYTAALLRSKPVLHPEETDMRAKMSHLGWYVVGSGRNMTTLNVCAEVPPADPRKSCEDWFDADMEWWDHLMPGI